MQGPRAAVLSIAAVVAFALVITTAPAQANPFGWQLATENGGRTYTANPGGHAEGEGRLEFLGGRRVELDTWRVTDVCNSGNDGMGAYAYLSIELIYKADPSIPAFDTFPIAFYTGPCNQGFAYNYDRIYDPGSDYKVKRVKVVLQECTASGQCSSAAKDIAYGVWRDNPFT
jgi:hypothetical protein